MKRLFFIIPIILILLLILVGMAPDFLSTAAGNRRLQSFINSRISGEVTFRRAQFSWTNGQSIKDLELRDHMGNVILTMDSFDTKTALLDWFATGKFGETSLRKLNIHLVEQDDGTSNLQQALRRKIPPGLDSNRHRLVVDLENVNGMISIGAPNIPKKISLVGLTRSEGIEGSFNIEIDSQRDDRNWLMEVQVKNFPVHIIDFIAAYENPSLQSLATDILGETLDVESSTIYRDGHSQINMTMKSPLALADLHGTIKQDILAITAPSELHLTLTPQLTARITDNPSFSHNAQMVVAIDLLKLPLEKHISDFLIKCHLDQERTDPAIVRYLNGTDIMIDVREGSLPHLVLRNRDIEADLLYHPDDRKVSGIMRVDQSTEFSLLGQITDSGYHASMKGQALSFTTDIDRRNATYRLKATAKEFPIAKVCRLICFDDTIAPKVEALIGATVSGEIDADVARGSGRITAGIDGSAGDFHINGYLNNGVLTLRAPLTATIQLTPLLGEEVLDELFPFLSDIVEADKPVRLVISEQGFSLPLMPFHLPSLTIQHGMLDLNRIVFGSEGQLGAVLSLLNPNAEPLLGVRFTPLYFNMSEGALRLERIDMLIMDEYPIALWGKVNIVKDKVSLTIGLSARAIEEAFKIRRLPPNYMLQLPLKGSMANASIDRRKAAARLSSLVAETRGIQGALISTVINIATGNFNEPSPPPPTTQPLPW